MSILLLLCVGACFPVLEAGLLNDLFQSEVCYDVIGCFNNSAPFTNSWHELPDSPKKVGVTLTLYTKSGAPEGEVLDFQDVKMLVEGTHYDLRENLKVIVHGYMDDGTEDWIASIREAFLSLDNFNVIIVTWGPGAHAVYNKAVANTRVVGAVLAHFLTSLKEAYNVSMSRVHLLGHSLGAHISGYVGSSVGGIARISGLDPAGPLFESTDPAVRIDPSDAQFVDCIHSDGVPFQDFGFGTLSAWCGADFYPNGGGRQPGCPEPASNVLSDVMSWKILDAENAVSCSHSRSHSLYTDSLRRCQFRATPCDSYAHFQAGRCACAGREDCVVPMGYHAAEARPRASGKYYLDTTGTEPFC